VFISAQNSTLPHSMRWKRRKLRSGSANSLLRVVWSVKTPS
jgi:hypothetical protein